MYYYYPHFTEVETRTESLSNFENVRAARIDNLGSLTVVPSLNHFIIIEFNFYYFRKIQSFPLTTKSEYQKRFTQELVRLI